MAGNSALCAALNLIYITSPVGWFLAEPDRPDGDAISPGLAKNPWNFQRPSPLDLNKIKNYIGIIVANSINH
ncbi:hypothetical protein O3M35_001185 [Rhynocoris fuscipes]|uniref:Uncharacterized protein n=1 Tax=Rhynocoris fuscipes TaxID=488301 RepID=A0AAW1DQC5_9HEMI